MTTTEATAPVRTPFRVYLDGVQDDKERPYVFDAMDDGTFWNGWRSPHFSFDVACDLGVKLAAIGVLTEYDPERDVFITLEQSDVPFDQLDTIPADQVDDMFMEWERDSDERFAIGAWGWCWGEYGAEEAEHYAQPLEQRDIQSLRHMNEANRLCLFGGCGHAVSSPEGWHKKRTGHDPIPGARLGHQQQMVQEFLDRYGYLPEGIALNEDDRGNPL